MKTFVIVYLAASIPFCIFLTWIGAEHQRQKDAARNRRERAGLRGGGGVFDHGSSDK